MSNQKKKYIQFSIYKYKINKNINKIFLTFPKILVIQKNNKKREQII